MESFYTIDRSNRFVTVVNYLEKIEEIDGDFMTEEEVREALGLADHICLGGYTFHNDVIAAAWAAQIARLPEAGGVEINDPDLIAAIEKDVWYIRPPDGYRLKGTELFKINRKAPKPNRQDVKELVYHGSRAVRVKYPGVDFNIFRPSDAPKSSITILTKLIAWEDLEASMEHASASTRPAMIKLLWDNPALLGC